MPSGALHGAAAHQRCAVAVHGGHLKICSPRACQVPRPRALCARLLWRGRRAQAGLGPRRVAARVTLARPKPGARAGRRPTGCTRAASPASSWLRAPRGLPVHRPVHRAGRQGRHPPATSAGGACTDGSHGHLGLGPSAVGVRRLLGDAGAGARLPTGLTRDRLRPWAAPVVRCVAPAASAARAPPHGPALRALGASAP